MNLQDVRKWKSIFKTSSAPLKYNYSQLMAAFSFQKSILYESRIEVHTEHVKIVFGPHKTSLARILNDEISFHHVMWKTQETYHKRIIYSEVNFDNFVEVSPFDIFDDAYFDLLHFEYQLGKKA